MFGTEGDIAEKNMEYQMKRKYMGDVAAYIKGYGPEMKDVMILRGADVGQ